MVGPACAIVQGWARAGAWAAMTQPVPTPLQLRQSGPVAVGALPWPSVVLLAKASLLHARPWGLSIPGGSGADSRSSHPTVCNFMSHEKCLKHVKTPCSSVAPSLVRVRTSVG